MIVVSWRGVNYNVPEPNDAFTQSLTDYLNAISTGAVPYPTAADVDLGASFGLAVAYLRSRTGNNAGTGILRLALANAIAWRNNANNADLSLGVGGQDQLQWRGSDVTGNPMLDASSSAAQSIPNSAQTIVVFGTVTRDTDSAYASGTGRYTVPVGKGGDYMVSAAIAWGAGAPGNNPSLAICKNATSVRIAAAQAAAPGANSSLPISSLLNLAAGDIVDIRATQISGGAIVLNADPKQVYFTLKRIPS